MTRLKGIKYLSVMIIPVMAIVAFRGQGLVAFAPVLYAFGLIPLLELWFAPDQRNLAQAEAEVMKKDPFFDWILYLMVPVQWLLVVYFLYAIQEPLTTSTAVGRILSMGILCGVFGINVGHELGHRKERFARRLAKILLLSSLYMHFYIEHNRGHHKRVSTEEDPASARWGEPLYNFWVRSVVFSYLSAWHLENERLQHLGSRPWSLKNEMIWYQMIQGGLLVLIYALFGLKGALGFLAASIFGILLLETVNYIEHYGLSRNKLENGRYEKVQPHHSWNSNHVLGRLMLFELSRHSDHHYKASKKYQLLEHHPHSPQMPTGYPGMMLLALIPPAWFGLMHRRMPR